MKKLYVGLGLVAVFLSGCSDGTPTQTVEWYKQHDAERKEMNAKCDDNPGKLENTPNCINSKQADNEKANTRRGVPSLAPIDFSKQGG